MKRAVILGGGMMGSAMAKDLAADPDFEVAVYERDADAVARLGAVEGVEAHEADLSDPVAVANAIERADIVLGALPSRIALSAMRVVIERGRDYVDIAFMEEDPRELDALARERGVTVVYDCGVAPGLSNVLAGLALSRMEEVHKLEIYVGGLPQVRTWPFQYKAPFAPLDVLEEYTRPSRIVEGGRLVVREALSEPELMDFDGVGTLEAFNTDGLRSLVDLPIPDMVEKTLRYPGHIELMRVLRAMGLFGKEPVDVGGVAVRPLDLTAKLMFPLWTFEEGEGDLTVFRSIAHGVLDGERVAVQHDLLDRYDTATNLSSMSRTTGFPCAIVGRMVARGELSRPGVSPPEALGRIPGFWQDLRAALAARGVVVEETISRRQAGAR